MFYNLNFILALPSLTNLLLLYASSVNLWYKVATDHKKINESDCNSLKVSISDYNHCQVTTSDCKPPQVATTN